jgi:uncharacterized HAD superfamily protein
MKELIRESEKYLLYTTTKEYLEYQDKFNTLCKQIKLEQQALKQIIKEIKENRENFIKSSQTKDVQDVEIKCLDDEKIPLQISHSFDKEVKKLDSEISNFNHIINNYNFFSI